MQIGTFIFHSMLLWWHDFVVKACELQHNFILQAWAQICMGRFFLQTTRCHWFIFIQMQFIKLTVQQAIKGSSRKHNAINYYLVIDSLFWVRSSLDFLMLSSLHTVGRMEQIGFLGCNDTHPLLRTLLQNKFYIPLKQKYVQRNIICVLAEHNSTSYVFFCLITLNSEQMQLAVIIQDMFAKQLYPRLPRNL